MTEREKMKRMVDLWKETGPLLERIRRKEVHETKKTMDEIQAFSGMMPHVLKTHPPKPWSGLIEQQEIFRKARP